jgi:uncharacterized integral membrane protein
MNDQNQESSRPQAAESGRNGPNVMLIALGIVAAIVAIFFFRNSDRSTLDFMVFEWNTTVRWSIFVSVVLGIVLDRIFSIWWQRRGKHKNKNNNNG